MSLNTTMNLFPKPSLRQALWTSTCALCVPGSQLAHARSLVVSAVGVESLASWQPVLCWATLGVLS